MKFKYIKMLAGRKLEFVSLPIIEITFPQGNFICLVDSGADYCYLPAVVGEAPGREGFFSLFKKVCFEHKQEEIELKPYI